MSTYSYVDIDQLLLVADGNNELIVDLIKLFGLQRSVYSSQFKELMDKQDFLALSKLAHKVKGSVATVGIVVLAETMKELEHNAGADVNEEVCQNLIDEYNTISSLALEELNHYIENNIKTQLI